MLFLEACYIFLNEQKMIVPPCVRMASSSSIIARVKMKRLGGHFHVILFFT